VPSKHYSYTYWTVDTHEGLITPERTVEDYANLAIDLVRGTCKTWYSTAVWTARLACKGQDYRFIVCRKTFKKSLFLATHIPNFRKNYVSSQKLQ
jgi:hypothetical protein